MKTGTVKFFNKQKGFGFIIDDETKEELFVHESGMHVHVIEGDKVTFEITEGKKGPNATNVQRV